MIRISMFYQCCVYDIDRCVHMMKQKHFRS